MPESDSTFFAAAEDWSKRKHLILGYYLKPAVPKIRTQSPDGRVLVVDGYAGQGRYDDDSPGSPILLGQLADECSKWRNPVDLRLFNIEANPTRFQLLTACTRGWEQTGRVRNIQGTFREHLPSILKEARSSPLFAFLDPFRPSQMGFADIEPLLTRRHLTEILIIFHTPAIRRLIATLALGASTSNESRERNRARLDAVFGGSRWEALVGPPLPSPQEIAGCLADEMIASVTWGQAFVCSTSIDARYGRGVKYHVMFVTRHPAGVELMNDAFARETQAVYQATGQPDQLALDYDSVVPPVEISDPGRVSRLAETMVAVGRDDPVRRWTRGPLIYESIARHFGQFLRKEHRAAVEELLSRPSPPRLLGGRRASTGRWMLNDATELRFEL